MPSRVRYVLWTAGVVFGLGACGGGGDGTGPDATAGSVSGSVTDTGTVKSPLAGIATRIQGGSVDRTASTNTQGQYRFDNLAPGGYTVSITVPDTFAADSRPTSAAVEVTAGATSTVPGFELRLRVGAVTGAVTDDVGKALGGRQVFIQRTGAASDAKPAQITDSNGFYAFQSVTIGPYGVRAQLVCGEPDPGPVAVTVEESAAAPAPTLEITPRPSEMLLSCDVQPILSRSCTSAGCHGASSPQLGLDLSSAARTIGTAVNRRAVQVTFDRIEPFRARQDSSYVVCKIEAVCPQRTLSRMPKGCSGSSCLSNAQIDTIKTWIAQGARNN